MRWTCLPELPEAENNHRDENTWPGKDQEFRAEVAIIGRSPRISASLTRHFAWRSRGGERYGRDIHRTDDVKKAYDDTKAEIERLGADVDDDTRATYDELTKWFDEIGTKIDDAGTKTGDEAKRAYRDIQHEFRDMDRDLDKLLDGVADTAKDAWHDIRHGLGHVHDEFDHVIDAL
jgi:hypothetical protein